MKNIFQQIPILLIALAILLVATPCTAEVIESVSTKYYTVTGMGRKEIIRNIKRYSPISYNGKTFHGNTASQLRYKFSWSRKNNKCAISKVSVFVYITYTYPKLANTPNKSTLKWWKSYMASLKEHELVHGEIAKESARELEKALNNLKNLNCDNVERRVKAKFKSIMQEFRKRQEDYDKLTKHGIEQERYQKK